MLTGIVAEVAQQPGQIALRAFYPRRAKSVKFNGGPAQLAQAMQFRQDQIVKIDKTRRTPRGSLGAAREKEQVVDQRRHPDNLALNVPQDEGRTRVLGVRQRHLHLNLQRRQWTAKFMRRVAHKLTLPKRGRLKSLKHFVHRYREARDLIGAAGHRYAL
jgi:hypothetical protein